jgi:hypothetical protein
VHESYKHSQLDVETDAERDAASKKAVLEKRAL